mmetsp:Transcript_45992/g.75021  ORF Transcript_45992/g.75021 Transcript_45992/m.75021 type:complete len:90 (+) Transcript_45992:247-516(+)|eukprot:CAMPEP_0184644574 /NCGR_PEP_ID=MMETSP0308-20130426/1280_1 /TAXON_ID=38269 /ORGANISM="Gloeochaete witrockiana, Strain SAG 46.84" /LENGTH=89 /DNA_ID=CAMNT_0027073185 /DNA_START=162 /DNA_END=431 /DNA_ORIENTATION=-
MNALVGRQAGKLGAAALAASGGLTVFAGSDGNKDQSLSSLSATGGIATDTSFKRYDAERQQWLSAKRPINPLEGSDYWSMFDAWYYRTK